MVNVPSVPEIITVNSETLQTQERDLLPSQNGFGSELQASNVIMPIIDLTAAAEGTTTPISMQQALAFGSQTAFAANNSTVDVENNAGFYRVVAVSNVEVAGSIITNQLFINDGVDDKDIFTHKTALAGSAAAISAVPIDLVVFLRAGDTLKAKTDNSQSFLTGSVRQIADVSGSLINPVGFNP